MHLRFIRVLTADVVRYTNFRIIIVTVNMVGRGRTYLLTRRGEGNKNVKRKV